MCFVTQYRQDTPPNLDKYPNIFFRFLKSQGISCFINEMTLPLQSGIMDGETVRNCPHSKCLQKMTNQIDLDDLWKAIPVVYTII